MQKSDDHNYLNNIRLCIEKANHDGLLSSKIYGELGGLSGHSTVGALQRLTKIFVHDPTACYLEIGVFQGLSLLSVANLYQHFPCFGIDNFSLLDPGEKNLSLVQELLSKFESKNAVLINLDFEVALKSLPEHIGNKKIGVYFVDGPHDYRSQLVGLILAIPHLHRNAIILIDDANYHFVRQSTNDFLDAFSDFKLMFEAYSHAHPANLDESTLKKFKAGWLNGINILVRDPGNILPDMRAPLEPDYSLFVNDWLVHRHGFAELAPEALSLAQAICTEDSAQLKILKAELLGKYNKYQTFIENRPSDRHTRSKNLPLERYNNIRFSKPITTSNWDHLPSNKTGPAR